MLNRIGKKTQAFLRISTTSGEGGFPDTLRDPRGFAVRFYTEDGNWDIVGNQVEVINMRDPVFFASSARCVLKPVNIVRILIVTAVFDEILLFLIQKGSKAKPGHPSV